MARPPPLDEAAPGHLFLPRSTPLLPNPDSQPRRRRPIHVDSRTVGLVIVALGLGLAAVGALIAVGALSWFGRLPGDLRLEGENTRVYVPLTSMILLSVVLTALIHLFRRLF